MPYQFCLEVEQSRLGNRGRDAIDIAREVEEVGGEMAKINMLDRQSTGKGGVREVDTSILGQ